MYLSFVWPGKIKDPALRVMEESYLKRIRSMSEVRVAVTQEARGLREKKNHGKILEIEAAGLEKRLKDDYIICLVDKGKQMTSAEFADFLSRRELETSKPTTFVVGEFLGLADRILAAADVKLSLSRMTFSHELSRVMLLEQIYRALTMLKGKKYAK